MLGRISFFEYLEAVLTLAAILCAVAKPHLYSRAWAAIEVKVAALAQRPLLSMAVIVIVAFCLRTLFLPFFDTPTAFVADELSMSLQADTYLHGRLANPVQLSPSFESIYVLLRPTYASMYPVLRSGALVLGGGLKLGYAAGVWLSVLAMCPLTYWALTPFVTRAYAFVAAAISVIHFAVFSWWVNLLLSPALTAVGGLLVVGAYGRIRERPTFAAGAWMGLGLFLLMTTRPVEGACFAFPVAIGVLVRLWPVFDRAKLTGSLKVAAPVLALVLAGLGLTAAHDRAVTGRFWLPPDTLYRQTKMQTPPFLLAAPYHGPPSDYAEVRSENRSVNVDFAHLRGPWDVSRLEAVRLLNIFLQYIGFALAIPFGLGVWRLRGEPVLAGALGLMFGVSLIESGPLPHYISPGFGVISLAIVLGLEALSRLPHRWRARGLTLRRLLFVALVAGYAWPAAATVSGRQAALFRDDFNSYCCHTPVRSLHARIEAALASVAGPHIVLVDERVPHKGEPVVFNSADPPAQRILWINDDARFNAQTAAQFPGRRLWRLSWGAGERPCVSPAMLAASGQTTPSGGCLALP